MTLMKVLPSCFFFFLASLFFLTLSLEYKNQLDKAWQQLVIFICSHITLHPHFYLFACPQLRLLSLSELIDFILFSFSQVSCPSNPSWLLLSMHFSLFVDLLQQCHQQPLICFFLGKSQSTFMFFSHPIIHSKNINK